MRFKIMGLILVLFLISSSLGAALKQEKFYFRGARVFDEYTNPGEEIAVVVNLENDGDDDLKRMRATVVIPDLGVRKSVGRFNIKSGKEGTKQIIFELPGDTESGWYAVRITISNDSGLRKVKHRYIFVG